MRGDILVERSDGNAVGGLIGSITHSNVCHVGLCSSDTEVIEATFWGVKKTNLSEHKKYELWRIKNVTPEQIEKAVKTCEKEIGCFYDFGSFIYLGWQFLTNQRDSVNQWDDDHKWICSELVDHSETEAGIDLVPSRLSDNVSPSDIVDGGKIFKVLTVG